MKWDHVRWGWLAAAMLLALNLMMLLWPDRMLPSAAETKRIQYRVVDVPGDTQTMQATLNEYGSTGWDLAAVAIGDIQVPRLIFKKQE